MPSRIGEPQRVKTLERIRRERPFLTQWLSADANRLGDDGSRLQIERYLQFLDRRKWVLGIPVVLGLLAAIVLSFATDSVYRASAIARVDVAAQPLDLDDPGIDRYINTYAEIMQTNAFLDRVIADLELDTTPRELKERVEAVHVEGTELVRVSAEASSAEEATATANTLGMLLQDPDFMSRFVPDNELVLTARIESMREGLAAEYERLDELIADDASEAQIEAQESVIASTEATMQGLLDQRTGDAVRRTQITRGFTLIEPATEPESPVRPRWSFNLAAGVFGGLFLGVALALGLEYVDPTIRRARDLQTIVRAPVLASVPFGRRSRIPSAPPHPVYRLLSTKLQAIVRRRNDSSLLFTSARADEGCTAVATYTAIALAQTGLRVLLLDANLKRPDVHRFFNMPLSPGLFSFISTNGVNPIDPTPGALARALRPTPFPSLTVMTAGAEADEPSEMLASPEMRRVLDTLEKNWDLVVVDGSDLRGSAGAGVLASVVDGVVLVAAEGRATSVGVEEVAGELSGLGARTLGVVYSRPAED